MGIAQRAEFNMSLLPPKPRALLAFNMATCGEENPLQQQQQQQQQQPSMQGGQSVGGVFIDAHNMSAIGGKTAPTNAFAKGHGRVQQPMYSMPHPPVSVAANGLIAPAGNHMTQANMIQNLYSQPTLGQLANLGQNGAYASMQLEQLLQNGGVGVQQLLGAGLLAAPLQKSPHLLPQLQSVLQQHGTAQQLQQPQRLAHQLQSQPQFHLGHAQQQQPSIMELQPPGNQGQLPLQHLVPTGSGSTAQPPPHPASTQAIPASSVHANTPPPTSPSSQMSVERSNTDEMSSQAAALLANFENKASGAQQAAQVQAHAAIAKFENKNKAIAEMTQSHAPPETNC
jgi:hypothetical protein